LLTDKQTDKQKPAKNLLGGGNYCKNVTVTNIVTCYARESRFVGNCSPAFSKPAGETYSVVQTF